MNFYCTKFTNSFLSFFFLQFIFSFLYTTNEIKKREEQQKWLCHLNILYFHFLFTKKKIWCIQNTKLNIHIMITILSTNEWETSNILYEAINNKKQWWPEFLAPFMLAHDQDLYKMCTLYVQYLNLLLFPRDRGSGGTFTRIFSVHYNRTWIHYYTNW